VTTPSDVVEHRSRPWIGSNEIYLDLLQPYGGFPGGVQLENDHIVTPDLPASGLRANQT
jgi:hypothetical protein